MTVHADRGLERIGAGQSLRPWIRRLRRYRVLSVRSISCGCGCGLAERVKYLSGYPQTLIDDAVRLRDEGRLGDILERRYPARHQVRDNAALREYVMDIKRTYLKQSPPLAKVRYSDKIAALNRALGTHTYAVRVQGAKLKKKHELRVASIFKDLAPEFLRMIVVHELAHLRHKEHDKAFYRLCVHMEPEYHRYELDLRLTLFSRLEA